MPAPATTTLLRVTCPAPLPPSAGPGSEATLGVCASGAGELDGGELVGGAGVGSSLGGAEMGEGGDAGGTKTEGDGAGEVTGGGEGGGVGVGSTGAGAGVAGVGLAVGLPAGAGVGDCATAVTAKMASKRREEEAMATWSSYAQIAGYGSNL